MKKPGYRLIGSLTMLFNIRANILLYASFLLSIGMFSGCNKKTVTSLDFDEYFSYTRIDTVYPSAKQIEMLKSVIPEKSFQPAPPISNRDYWERIAASESGKEYFKNALSVLDKKPEVPITDEIYRRANLEGNRGIYKPRYYITMERLGNFIMAECMENQGRFLPQINVYLDSIMTMKSWLHPNHDSRENDVLEGRTMAIDLGAQKFGSVLTLAEVLLGDKLPDGMRKKMSNELHRRIIDCYLDITSGGRGRLLSWYLGSSNWNAVCTSGSVLTTISFSDDQDKRLAAVGCALNSMRYYLDGFGDDGYCSEGAGYWDYGFGHYLYLAQILYDYTGGKINLFDAGNPEKLGKIGSFPENYQIQNGTCAPFSDGASRVAGNSGFSTVMAAKHLGARKPSGTLRPGENGSLIILLDEPAYQLIAWANPGDFILDTNVNVVNQKLPDYTFFDKFGMVISRGKQEVPFSIAIKAGHNAENHNHMDVGTYTIVLNSDFITGDIGAPSYTAGAFDNDNLARSSWGHPVPRIDNILQSPGRSFSGKITSTEFTEAHDKVVMDIKAAYEIPYLTKLERTMENDKSGLGTISITEQFSSSKPVVFGTTLMTYAKYEIVDARTIILTTENHKVKAEVTGTGALIKITDEIVPVEHLRMQGRAYRIGIDFTKPITEGMITVKYTPVL